jgi:UDP-glucose 4-epimerase
LASEYYCAVFHKIYNLSTVCLRYFNVYGPRQNVASEYAGVIPKFIQTIKVGKSPVIFGDGNQTRDFIFVKDIVRANLLAAENHCNGIFNIGSGVEVSLNQLLQIIFKTMHIKNIKPIYEKERIGDIKRSFADISRGKNFGFTPKYVLENGIEEILKSN